LVIVRIFLALYLTLSNPFFQYLTQSNKYNLNITLDGRATEEEENYEERWMGQLMDQGEASGVRRLLDA
jgi:hypothetical protein